MPARLQSELGRWLESSPRFSAYLANNQAKVRKKLGRSSPDDEGSRQDVRSELLVAYLLLSDRRFELSFEAYGARRLGPDLTVTFRANQRFNLEVTRLRAEASGTEAAHTGEARTQRLAGVIAGKLRQLPGDVPNGLVITTCGLAPGDNHLADALRLLKVHTDQKDEAFFARRGLENARAFHAQYLHLSGVFLLDEATAIFVANRQARKPLPKEALAALSACLKVG